MDHNEPNAPSIPITLTANITNNTITNLRTAADGIDANVGTNCNLVLTATGNTIDKVGNEALTFDSFGANSNATLYIAQNTLKTTGDKIGSTDGIAITLHEYNALGRDSNGKDANPAAAYSASSNYKITIKGNTIAANTENINNDVGAEGIKFKIAQGLPSGYVNLDLAISNNNITVTHGDGIEIDANEDAGASVIFKGDIALSNNNLTNLATSSRDPRDVLSSRIAENAAASKLRLVIWSLATPLSQRQEPAMPSICAVTAQTNPQTFSSRLMGTTSPRPSIKSSSSESPVAEALELLHRQEPPTSLAT